MKKLLLSFIFLSVVIFAYSQGTHIYLDSDESVIKYDGKTGDTLRADSALYKYITIKEPGYYNYTIEIDADTVATAGYITTSLYGRFNLYDDWTFIDSVHWALTVDTIMIFSNTTDYTNSETIAQHTITIPAFVIAQDSVTQPYFADSVRIPALTQTIAAQTITNTVTQGGVNWPELKILLQATSSTAKITIDDIVGIINRKKY